MKIQEAIEVLEKLKLELPRIEIEKYKYTGIDFDSEFIKTHIYDYKKEIEAIETLIEAVEKVRKVLKEVENFNEPQNVNYEYNSDYCFAKDMYDLIEKLKSVLEVEE